MCILSFLQLSLQNNTQDNAIICSSAPPNPISFSSTANCAFSSLIMLEEYSIPKIFSEKGKHHLEVQS